MSAIYFDNQASTPLDPRVYSAMQPYLERLFGNPHSIEHGLGMRLAGKVQEAREQVAQAIGADEREVIFTSGATEANNLAIQGAALFESRHRRSDGKSGRRKILTFATEHKCVLESCRALARDGFEVEILPVKPDGLVDLEQLKQHLDEQTLLVSVMLVNNEIGLIQPLAAIAEACRQVGAKLHCDAAQALGKVAIDVSALGVDLMSLSAHKCYGPMGIGALYLRRRPRMRIEPLFHGGGQERGLRSGTLPLPLCIGFGKAAQLAAQEQARDWDHMLALRQPLLDLLQSKANRYRINGSLDQRVPHNLNFSFMGQSREAMLKTLTGFSVSSGSACSAADVEPSYVLTSLGVTPDEATASVRISLGRQTTEDQVAQLAAALSL